VWELLLNVEDVVSSKGESRPLLLFYRLARNRVRNISRVIVSIRRSIETIFRACVEGTLKEWITNKAGMLSMGIVARTYRTLSSSVTMRVQLADQNRRLVHSHGDVFPISDCQSGVG